MIAKERERGEKKDLKNGLMCYSKLSYDFTLAILLEQQNDSYISIMNHLERLSEMLLNQNERQASALRGTLTPESQITLDEWRKSQIISCFSFTSNPAFNSHISPKKKKKDYSSCLKLQSIENHFYTYINHVFRYEKRNKKKRNS